MKKNISKDFWEKWVKADELEKIKLIKTLPLFRGGNTFKYMNATLLNSYLIERNKKFRSIIERNKEFRSISDETKGFVLNVDLYNHMREKT